MRQKSLRMDTQVIMILFTLLNYGSIVRSQGCLTCSKGLEQRCCQRFRLCCLLQNESKSETLLPLTMIPLPSSNNETLSSSTNGPLPSSTSGTLPTSTNGPLLSSTNGTLPTLTNAPSSTNGTLLTSTNRPLPPSTDGSLSYSINGPLTPLTNGLLISSTDGKVESKNNETILSTKYSQKMSINNKTVPSTEMMVNNDQATSTTNASTSKPKWGRCPVDRFANTIVTRTVCLRRTCSYDSDCNFIQKCCPYGETKCCVYPLYI